MIFKPHTDKQYRAVYSDSPVTALITGLQFGKSLTGAWWLRRLIHKYNNPDDTFIITAPTYKIMNQSTLPVFKRVMEGCGTYNKVEAEFKVHGGGTVYMRTATEPDSIVGITKVRGIWGDEAGKYTRYFWDNMEGRAAFCDCSIMLTTTPYSLNWLYRSIMKPAKEGKRDDIELIQAASVENPYFSKEVYYRRKENMDPRRFNAMYGGNFEKMQGLVYAPFCEDENMYDTADLSGARYFGGIDWGFTDPFVFKVRAITPTGQHYSISEFYKTGMTLTGIKELLQRKKKVFNLELIYCDPSEPGYIEELNQAGIPCVPADNDIKRGIDIHYELIKSRRYKMLRGANKNTEDEYSTYHWPEPKDLGPDQNAKPEKPVDQHNHCADCERYISIMTHNLLSKKRPGVHEEVKNRRIAEEPVDFVKRIRKNKTYNSQTEQWS